MQIQARQITPCLWFDGQAEEAARFYTSIFTPSRIGKIARYGKAGREIHGQPEGKALVVEFELNGRKFTALNGGPQFTFNEAISFQVHCETQEEIDYFWQRLSEGGPEEAQRCGWLKDRFGVSWQVVPAMIGELVGDPADEGSQRAMNALQQMKKIDIEALRRAYEGVDTT